MSQQKIVIVTIQRNCIVIKMTKFQLTSDVYKAFSFILSNSQRILIFFDELKKHEDRHRHTNNCSMVNRSNEIVVGYAGSNLY
jgi:hypothetical protein